MSTRASRATARRRSGRLLTVVAASGALVSGLLGAGAPGAAAASSVPSWVIPLYNEDWANGSHRACTGIVLSKTKTLATPDCFTGMDEQDMASEYSLTSGQITGGAGGISYRSHPQYDATSRRAALTVVTRRTPDNSGKPVLAAAADSALRAAGAKATYYSWSGLDLDSAPRVRHSEQVVVKSAAECASLLGAALPSGALCTAPAPGAPPVADEDQCFGDAGGALVAGGKLVAVSATKSTGCVQGGVRLYTRIDSYRALVDEWSRDVDLDYRNSGSVLALEKLGTDYYLIDICTTDTQRRLQDCYVDSTGSAVAGGYSTLLQAGDMNGDGYGDMIARTTGGTLYRVPSSDAEGPDGFDHRVRIGGGWNIYNQLVGVRDISGDGRVDLIGRDSGGVLWLYRGTGDGKFAGRTRIGGGWNVYTSLAGRGDLSGDGRSDLVARDRAGVLWLYRGNGKGGYAARTRVGGGWNVYNAIVASGDMDHNGRQDILTRTPAGAVYLYNADHKGGFDSRKQLAVTRWKNYAKIS
ncbi:FG-GAP-like repeat-containing protein [Streptomyces sp. NBC_00316]|uniref:FG-GAP-like repeat-containing protein n=1 Tax=Streptomyces sp. NBC_00316 TaxID=2975710 RepID=UPI002E27F54E|nr:FG-GAP-like repeat-containing protein [Streptomyces sp. NBC_00316]